MYRTSAIQKLREKLAAEGLQAMIIPTNDPHFGEYTQEYYAVRAWLSGFTGSAGTLVVTLAEAALWTDSRYFVQAERELNGVDIELMKLKMPGTPSVGEWLKESLTKRSEVQANGSEKGEKCFAVAIDEAIFSYNEFLSLEADLAPECKVVPVKDPFNEIWDNRPALAFNEIIHLPVGFSGEDTSSKYAGLVEKLAPSLIANSPEASYEGGDTVRPKFAYIVTACDEVAWLCNIRGTDVEYNPVAQAYSVVTEECVHLFAAKDKILRETLAYLAEQDVEIHDYNEYELFLKSLGGKDKRVVICSKGKLSVRDYNALSSNGDSVIIVDDPVTGGALNLMKAIKNEVELEGFRRAYLYDGVAWCRLLKFIDDSLKAGKSLTEFEIGMKLIEFRKDRIEYRGESFEPIVAFGPNGALPHYSATEQCSSTVPALGPNVEGNFLLMDTGAQYLFGTTDTTRTIPVGELDEDKKRFYTLVLKGMVSLSMAKFPKGTRGAQLDILARGPLFGEGAMYFHGTGHGTGHYLCVHEGPQSIRMEENPVTLEQGMVMSNEPAIYFNGRYGIRTENVIAVREWKETEFNKFYEFETFTLVPIATSCILPEFLSNSEKEWLNAFNARVFGEISPLLENEEDRSWLKKNTEPLV
ncbi:MAG: aminopeptidase P family protein [Bacteroidales bacterium]|nr:aminopeptidase P family protein [Bacteroidales bacterium]